MFTQALPSTLCAAMPASGDGMAFTNNLQMKGPNAAVLLEAADMCPRNQDIPRRGGARNHGHRLADRHGHQPGGGLGSFWPRPSWRPTASIQASTQTFRIRGTWSDPLVEKSRRPTPRPAQPRLRPSPLKGNPHRRKWLAPTDGLRHPTWAPAGHRRRLLEQAASTWAGGAGRCCPSISA